MAIPKKFFDYSYKILLFASFLLMILGCFPACAQQLGDAYSIENIIVDSDGKDTDDARTKALSEGQTEAFRQYVTKRTPAKAAEIIAKFAPADINRMISGFEIVDEKITPNHYHASLRYNFFPQVVNAQLPPPDAPSQKNAADESAKSKAVLVVPILKEGGALKLWQDDNKWREIWYASALEAGNGIVVMPLGNLDDRVDITDDNLGTVTLDALSRMSARYGVGGVYIVTAYFNKKAEPRPTLEVSMKKLLPGGKDETSQMDYVIHSGEDTDALMARASSDIAQHLYKLQTINPDKIEYDRLKEINAHIKADDVKEWEALRKKLLEHGNIVGIKVTSVSFFETDIVITFRGTPDMLGKTLVASGLRVLQDGDALVLMLK